MDREGANAFCPRCGTPVVAGASFCTACAFPVGPLEPVATPARRSYKGWWVALFVVWGILLGCGALGGFGWGFFMGPGQGTEIPSPEQQRVLTDLGSPDAFFVGDGPVVEDGSWTRAEVWIYPDDGMRYEFVEGRLADEQQFTFTEEFADSAYAPTDFGRSQARDDVEALLGESGETLPAGDGVWEGLEGVRYPQARLLVGYIDDWLYLVQTY